MSIFTYNGVGFEGAQTEFRVSPQYDESGTDHMWNVYAIKVRGFPVGAGGSLITPSAAMIASIKERLAVPRKELFYQGNDGITIVANAGIDAGMGPQLVGEARTLGVSSGSILMEVTYKVCLRDCVTGNPNPVVSLRWESTEDANQLHYAKIATSGTLVVRSDLRQSADSFRDLCTPKVATGFIRTTAQYRLSHDGTRLHFNFVDEEQLIMPPVVARKATGRFMVNVTKGSQRFGQCDVRLEGGPRGPSHGDMMVVALKIALAKLQKEGLLDSNLLDIKASESLWERSVDVSMSARLTNVPGADAAKAAGDRIAFFKGVGEGPNADTHRDGLAPEIASKVGGLIVAMFRDPCAAAALDAAPELETKTPGTKPKLKRTQPVKSTRNSGGGGAAAYSLVVSDLPFTGPATVKDEVPYDHYLISSEFHDESGIEQMPGTGVGADGHKAAFLTVHGGRLQLKVFWTAKRTGTPPVLPAKDSADPNFVYLKGYRGLEQIEMGADGYSPTYEVSGWYLYGARDPDAVNYAAPVPPFLANAVGPAAGLAAAHFSNDILWKFRGQPYQVGRVPNDQLTTQLGGAADQPIQFSGGTTTTGGGDTPTGGGPPVNA